MAQKLKIEGLLTDGEGTETNEDVKQEKYEDLDNTALGFENLDYIEVRRKTQQKKSPKLSLSMYHESFKWNQPVTVR